MFGLYLSFPLFLLAIVLNLAGIYYFGRAQRLRCPGDRRLAYAFDAAATLALIASVVHQENFLLFLPAIILTTSVAMVLSLLVMLMMGWLQSHRVAVRGGFSLPSL